MKSMFTKKENITYSLLKRVAIPVLGIAMGWMLEAGTAQAAQLKIANSGFEDTVIPEEGSYGNTYQIPGWDLYNPSNLIPANFDPTQGGTVVTYPSKLSLPGGATEGFNDETTFLATPGSGVAGISQTLTDTLQPNTKYNLQVDILNPQSFGDFQLDGFPGYRVELLAGGNVIAADNNTNPPADGAFTTSNVSFTTAADSPYLGTPLGIRLIDTNIGPGRDVAFDNVRLTATPVPESNAILGILLATGIGYGIKRRSTQLVKIS